MPWMSTTKLDKLTRGWPNRRWSLGWEGGQNEGDQDMDRDWDEVMHQCRDKVREAIQEASALRKANDFSTMRVFIASFWREVYVISSIKTFRIVQV